MENKKVLVVEDEIDIQDLIKFHLESQKYIVESAINGKEALEKAVSFTPDLILLDIMMPELTGYEVIEELKKDQELKDIRVIMVSAKGQEDDVIKGFDLGADDYINKPFSPKILMARVNAVLSRTDEATSDELTVNEIGLVINNEKREVFIDEQRTELTFSEFEILKLMAAKPGRCFTRSQIVDLIRGHNHAITDRAVDVQIVGLRKKMGEKSHYIETVRGVGYRFKDLAHD